MGLPHYIQDMSRIPLKYHKNIYFYVQYRHPTLICRGTDKPHTQRQTHGWTENIYSIFRDKLLLPGEHVLTILQHFKMDLALITDGNSDQTTPSSPAYSVLKLLVQLRGHRTMGSEWLWVGQQKCWCWSLLVSCWLAFWVWNLCRNWYKSLCRTQKAVQVIGKWALT